MGARSWSTPSPPPPPAPPGPLLLPCTSPSSSPPLSPLPTPSPVTYQQYQRKRQQHHPQAHHSARSKTAQHPHPHPHPPHVGYQQITDLPLPLPAHVYPAGAWPSSATVSHCPTHPHLHHSGRNGFRQMAVPNNRFPNHKKLPSYLTRSSTSSRGGGLTKPPSGWGEGQDLPHAIGSSVRQGNDSAEVAGRRLQPEIPGCS